MAVRTRKIDTSEKCQQDASIRLFWEYTKHTIYNILYYVCFKKHRQNRSYVNRFNLFANLNTHAEIPISCIYDFLKKTYTMNKYNYFRGTRNRTPC